MIFTDEQELPCHSAGQLLFCHGQVHKKLRFTLVNFETNLEKYGAVLYNNVCTHAVNLFLMPQYSKFEFGDLHHDRFL